MRIPAFWSAVAFVAGVVTADYFDFSTYLILSILVLLLILTLILLKYSSRILSTLLLLTLFLAGLWRYELATSDFPWNHVSNFTNLNSSVILRGQIVEDPDVRSDRTYLTAEADSLTYQLKKIEVQGKILIKIKEASNRFNYGDEIIVYGYLFSPLGKRNPGSFDYVRYLNTKGIYGQLNLDAGNEVYIRSEGGNFILSKIISPVRKYILRHFHQSLPPPYDNFLAGFVLGEKRGMPKELIEKFARTGTLHLMAVSGSNVGLVLAFAYVLTALIRFPRWLKFLFLSLVIIFFALLTNLQPSVVRASIMALLALAAFYTEREITFLNLVSLTVLLILFFNPQALYDISFQLSFASVAAIGILVPQMQKIYTKFFRPIPRVINRWLVLPFFVSTAAILGVAPLQVYYFDNFPVIGFASNLVIVPLVGIIVILGSLSAIISLLATFAANVIVAANWLLLKITLIAVDFFGNFSFSLIEVPHPPMWLFWLYPVTLLLLFFTGESKKARVGLALTLFLGITLLTFPGLSARQHEQTKITVLDVAPAQAVLFQVKDKNILLVKDYEPLQFNYLERTVVPFLYKKGINRLYAVVFLDTTDYLEQKLTSLESSLSINKVYILPNAQTSSITVYSIIKPLAGEIQEMEGLKLSLVYPDNRKEPSGLVFELKDLLWLQVEQWNFFEKFKQEQNQPAIGCLDYELFKKNAVESNLKMLDEIIIAGWDFRTSKIIEKNLSKIFADRRYFWTRKTGAVEVISGAGKLEFYPTLKE